MAFGTTPRRELLAPNLDDDVADLAIVNGRHVNVNSGEIVREDVAIEGDRIAYVGDVDHLVGEATEVIDAEGRYLTPGLIDAHIHSYHSYINGTAFARYMLGHGVTAYADGFYGQAVVGGLDAVELCKRELEATPLRLVFLVPCIAHHQQDEIDHPPANPADRLTDDELFEMLSWDDCYGLEEPTPGPILTRDETYLDLFEATVDAGKVVTGHAAGLSTPDLNAYAAMGARTDRRGRGVTVTGSPTGRPWSGCGGASTCSPATDRGPATCRRW
jgi:adenine deaminase